MPSRNTIKVDSANTYYHVYARGNRKEPIFLDDADYAYFIKLFDRYLSKEQRKNKLGYTYPTYSKKIELLAYCLMQNHFHLLIYQCEQGAMTGFMRGLMTSYSLYYNLKYKRTGHVFESNYKASKIDQQNYLEHISRYIHLNPRYWKRFPYSSLQYYFEKSQPDWLLPAKITSLFRGKKEYLAFLSDYEDYKQMLDEIKHELADH